jgi:hypothetical protein
LIVVSSSTASAIGIVLPKERKKERKKVVFEFEKKSSV